MNEQGYKLNEKEIIKKAIEKFKPVKILLLFSGGHDSVVCSHRSALILRSMGYEFEVYHGNTGTGCPETFDYVESICKIYAWKLNVGSPPKGCEMEDIVRKWGFPKSTRQGHQMCYVRLKERAIRKIVTHKFKSSPHARENILLITGVRQSESAIRMGYTVDARKEGSRVWCNPIFYWDEQAVKDYMTMFGIPKNPIKEKMCISGECLCGAYDSPERLAELKEVSLRAYNEIKRLQQIARDNGKNDIWGGKGAYKPKQKENKRQLDMFMCIGCETKVNTNLNN